MKNQIYFATLATMLLCSFQSRGQQKVKKSSIEAERLHWYPTKVSPPPKTHFDLEIFPNPAAEMVEIRLPHDDQRNQGFELQVFNNQGSQIFSQKWEGSKLDVCKFPEGHYIVVLRKDKLVFSQKLVVARE